jgi:hypothetical protein
MAITKSGVYGLGLKKMLSNTTAMDLTLTTNKAALYTNVLTPNFDTDATYAATNEVVGSGYTAGGIALTTPTVAVATSVLTWNAANLSWATSTITARAAIYYAAGVTNELIYLQTFGADVTSTAGTFQVTQNASGIVTITYAP